VGWLRPERHEKVVVTDNRTDGYGAIMRFEYYSPSGLRGARVFIVDAHNDGDPTRLNLDIREGWSFSFTVCLWKDSNTVTTTCGRAQVLKT
jgi:hypothetical protein